MLRIQKTLMVLASTCAMAAAHPAMASQAPATNVEFDTSVNPTQALSSSVFHYGVGGTTGGTFGFGGFPANQTTANSQIVALAGGTTSLLPNYTYFGLYSVQIGTGPKTYGICVAINQASYPTAAGESFDQLFDTNVNAAYNDGNSHTEADLINQLLNNGVADAAFTAGITNTAAADIPYGQNAPLVLFSNGTLGGSITTTATAVPEPMSVGLLLAAGMPLLSRRRRNR